jgi:hypothetical protein
MANLKEVKAPSFNSTSKMNSYDIIFDPDVEQARCGFINYRFVDAELNANMGDFYWAIEPGYEHRPDLISFKFYKTARYDWVIEQLNNIKDPIRDLVAGRRLRIFSEDHLLISM